ncbi:MAG TPA: MFS transporter [Edaphobacter sp.]|nr:MFS transporter [Edaphobacter sp.]
MRRNFIDAQRGGLFSSLSLLGSGTNTVMDAEIVAQHERHESLLDRVGIPSGLAWGFLGLLLFMIGDGVESGYLAPYLSDFHFSARAVGLIFTMYGVAAALAGWLSGALSEALSPRVVIFSGLVLWILFEVLFLTLGIRRGDYAAILTTYALRGLGYPLFAYGFLVWIAMAVPKHRLGSAMGWFWFAFTGGLPTLGSQVAKYSIPRLGTYATLWLSMGIVLLGGAVLLLGVRERHGGRNRSASAGAPFRALLESLLLAGREPKVLVAAIVRMINTAPEFGFFIILPAFFQKNIGFTQSQFFNVLSTIFLSNIVWNLLFGLIGDRLGWRKTIAYCGGFGCTISTLLLYYAPLHTHSYYLTILVGMFYGATLAGYVPLSALTPMLTPDHRGEALSLLSLGASAAMILGPAIITIFLRTVGIVGIMWIFAALYFISGILALTLTGADDPILVE